MKHTVRIAFRLMAVGFVKCAVYHITIHKAPSLLGLGRVAGSWPFPPFTTMCHSNGNGIPDKTLNGWETVNWQFCE